MGNPVEQFLPNRQLFIFGKETNQSVVLQQIQMLDSEADGVKERSLKITVVEKAHPLYREYQVKSGQFTVILVGKDQTEKHRTHNLLYTEELFAIIDAMPMRKAEMGKKELIM